MSNDALLRAFAVISKRERRERLKQALAIIKQAQRAGLSIKAAVVEGVVELQFGKPEAAPDSFNEWDQDLGNGTHPPQVR